MHNTVAWYRDSGTALPKGGFFKGDMRDSEAHWRRYDGTWKWHSEESKNLYHIERVDNVADESKIRFWVFWNKNVNWAAQKDFIQDAIVKSCQLPVLQGDTEGSFIPFHELFTSIGNDFA